MELNYTNVYMGVGWGGWGGDGGDGGGGGWGGGPPLARQLAIASSHSFVG